VTWIVVTLLALVAWAWLVHWRPTLTLGPIRVDPFEIVLLLLVLASAGLVLRTRSRLTAVAALGGVGVGVSLLFLLYSAPDVAATQFAVETLAVLLFVFVIYKLPRFSSLSSAAQRRRDAALALAAGVMVSALVLAVSAREHVSRIAPWMAEESVPSGMGRNVVNVILVDFRALDTLGEVIVLTIAAIGVLALLAARKRAGGEAS
jgi:multicomponent Na+:H+ antiporter subunit A